MALVMSNIIINLVRSQQFKFALMQGNTKLAGKILQEIQKSGAKLSWLEKLFRDKRQFESYTQQYKKETANLNTKLSEVLQQDNFLLKPDIKLIEFIYEKFNLIEHDENKLQCTGIDRDVFDDLEIQLVEFLQEEFSRIPNEKLVIKLEDALEDINALKAGKDPDYRFSLTPHVYFMTSFLENVYCVYLAWFFIYQAGLLPTKVNILDIAAGPATVAYSLALFLETANFFYLPQIHISYFSLEKQDAFQYRGLQFWRRYIESRQAAINTFYRFVTEDILAYDPSDKNIPKNFFDFVVVSHCFFTDSFNRSKAHNNYKQIFNFCLKNDGYVLLVIQDKKLFRIYDAYKTEDSEQEKKVVKKFITELGLELVWYKYLTSTGFRTLFGVAEFAKFAKEELPAQKYISLLLQKYLAQKHQSSYTLDDYVILAKKSS